MVRREKRIFLDFLAGRSKTPVLFEPFLSRRHAETLIWRRGSRLWDDPTEEVRTLVSVTERTGADFVWIDLRDRDISDRRKLRDAVLTEKGAEGEIGFGFLCSVREDVDLAEPAADALGLYGDLLCPALPVIRMDGTLADAVRRGDCAWFAADGIRAEDALKEASGKIRILGGLGVGELSSPALLYARVEKLGAEYPGEWGPGSGGTVAEDDYLGLIAMLGAYARIREWAERT